MRRLLRRLLADPLLEADYVEELQQGPKRGRRFSPGKHVKVAGVADDTVRWNPGGSITSHTGSYRPNSASRWK